MSSLQNVEERVARCVRDAIRELNTLQPADAQVIDHDNAILFGSGGQLDSLGLVNLAVELQATVEREFGETIGVVTELVGADDPSKFRTVADMVSFIAASIRAKAA